MSLRLLLSLSLFLSFQDGGRRPPPDAASQKDAEKAIRDIYKDDYAKKAPADRASLAARLVEQARKTSDDPKSQFVLFREAQDLYGQAGDLDAAFKTIDELARGFSVDGIEFKSAVLLPFSKAAKSPDELRVLISAQLRLADDAVAADQYGPAEKAVATAVAVARKAALTAPASRASAKGREVAELKGRFEKTKKARETLAASPEDPSANVAAGQYYCFAKGNWELGLPMLARGSDAALKALAARELAKPAEAAEQGAIGDAWWDLSEKEPGIARDTLKRHAIAWYEQASGKAVGLNKARIDKRIADYASDRLYKGTWLDVTDPKMFNKPGKPGDPIEFPKTGDSVCNLPPGDFDGLAVRLKPGPDAVILIEYDKTRGVEFAIEVDKFDDMRIEGNSSFIDGAVACPKKDEHQVLITIGDGVFIVHLDGQESFRIKTAVEKLATLRVRLYKGKATIEQVRLRRRE